MKASKRNLERKVINVNCALVEYNVGVLIAVKAKRRMILTHAHAASRNWFCPRCESVSTPEAINN